MSHKTFSAGRWFGPSLESPTDSVENCVQKEVIPTAEPTKNRFPTFKSPRQHQPIPPCEGFQPARFLTPGWRGESLPSKASSRFMRLVEQLQADVSQSLISQDFNRSLKLGIYNEFLTYAKDHELHCQGLDELSHFWSALKEEKLSSPLEGFLHIFSSRIAVITLFKLRFIKVLSQTAGIECGARCAHNPNHWLSQVFRTGTRLELKARVMETNVFSWYRPSEHLGAAVNLWMAQPEDLSIAELIKFTSPHVQGQKSKKIYSHTLSHLNFGLFLNSLLINFPLWVESREPSDTTKFTTPEALEIISCKYLGDYMESLALSHWLAQYNNKELKWDQVLCPDFKGQEFESGLFLKILNELQFITFLAEIATYQGQKPVEFISKVMEHHFHNRKSNVPHRSHHLLGANLNTSTYDRTVLNLCHIPKANPYHWIMTKLEEQSETLKSGGWLYLISTKSLFAPSQKERLQSVLKTLDLKAVFDLEEVKGKGEMGHWLYVFRKRHAQTNLPSRENVAWFRFTADMQTFQDFTDITDVLRSFYLTHLDHTPAMWQSEWGRSFRIEFFQDSLMDGHHFHLASGDTNRVTHPKFFKAMMDNCIALDTVFDLRPIDPEDWQASKTLTQGLKRDGASFLMVDLRDSDHPLLSIHPIGTFRAVYYESGSSQCHYFLIAAKQSGIDPNVLRKYFASPIGQQLIRLTFSGTSNKIKGQLIKMLVPRWFVRSDFLPDALTSTLEMFHWGRERLVRSHPDELLQRFEVFQRTAPSLFPRYACDVLSGLVELENTLTTLSAQLIDPRYGTQIDFRNPALQQELMQLKTIPLMQPAHPDLYVEFSQGIDSFDLESPISRVELRSQVEGELKTWFLEVFNSQRLVLRLHSDEELLLFTQFILQNAQGRALGLVLKALRLPLLQDVRAIVAKSREQQQVFGQLLQKTSSFIEESFRLNMLVEKV